MNGVHLIDVAALILGVVLAILFRARIQTAARIFANRVRRWRARAIDVALGRRTMKAGEKSLPFAVFVRMPEADYLAIATFRPYISGRARGRKTVEVRTHIVMQPGEQIPLPPPASDGERDSRDAVYSLLLPHADNLKDAAEQVARYATAIRLRRAGWRWTPGTKETEPNDR